MKIVTSKKAVNIHLRNVCPCVSAILVLQMLNVLHKIIVRLASAFLRSKEMALLSVIDVSHGTRCLGHQEN